MYPQWSLFIGFYSEYQRRNCTGVEFMSPGMFQIECSTGLLLEMEKEESVEVRTGGLLDYAPANRCEHHPMDTI